MLSVRCVKGKRQSPELFLQSVSRLLKGKRQSPELFLQSVSRLERAKGKNNGQKTRDSIKSTVTHIFRLWYKIIKK